MFTFLGLLGFKLHRNTIHNFLKKNGIKGKRSRYTSKNEDQLREDIAKLNKEFPRSGYREMRALLQTSNPPIVVQREKVRLILREVDPVGTLNRLSTAVKRRTYSVSTPNILWHLDTNHKLIR